MAGTPGSCSCALILARNARASLIDGEMVSWYGSRAIQGLRYLASYLSGSAIE